MSQSMHDVNKPNLPDDDKPSERQDWVISEDVQTHVAERMAHIAAGIGPEGQRATPRDAFIALRTLDQLQRLSLEQQRLDILRRRDAADMRAAEEELGLEDFTEMAAQLAHNPFAILSPPRPKTNNPKTNKKKRSKKVLRWLNASDAAAQRPVLPRQGWGIAPSLRRAVVQRLIDWADPRGAEAAGLSPRLAAQAARGLAALARLALTQQRLDLMADRLGYPEAEQEDWLDRFERDVEELKRRKEEYLKIRDTLP
jgi:hypothetical protein